MVTEPAALIEAAGIVHNWTGRVDTAASRFRPDSEVCRIAGSDRTGHVLSQVLAQLVAEALHVAELTGGAVDPTLGRDLVRLGYPDGAAPALPFMTRRADWRDVELDGRELRIPKGTLLDLGATAKASAADHCARRIADRLGVGALVSLGGDLAVGGEQTPTGGWTVDVCDGPGQPRSIVTLTTARGLATSSTLHRTWTRGDRRLHHVLDPVTRQPAPPVWRTVSAAAATCLSANALTTAALVWGRSAPNRLRAAQVAARLIAKDGSIVRLAGWPA